jgi:two-component system phosphate regulon sensor histidine kinase PhoR
MRSTLFLHILFFSLAIIAVVILSLSFFGFINPTIPINTRNILLIILFFFSTALIAFLISSRYIQPINQISEQINNPSKLTETFKKSHFLPAEIKQIFLSILKYQSKNNDIQTGYLADRKMFTSILANMNDGLLITTEDGNVSIINKTVRQIFGLEQDDLIGYSLAEVLRNHKVNELWQKCALSKQQEMTSFETSPQKSSIQCIATPLDPELPGNILFLFQDLTRMRQLEIIRRDFVSNVSHELRTPLASLKLITETLQEGALQDPPAAKKFLRQMDCEVDNLTQMVEELLELSRVESGQVPLEKQWVKPCLLIQMAGERMVMQAERAELKFSFQCDENLPNIFIDSPRLSRALVNLLHNAIKFTPSGGKVEVSAYQKDNNIIFFVKDSGVGIPQKDLERIFERFYKSDPSRSNRGTGLGLSISKHLVEAHDGKIWAERNPQFGSTIKFTIPIGQHI